MSIKVTEDKFNGTATFVVENAASEEEAKRYARKFWKGEYDTRPSRTVAEEDKAVLGDNRWIVMVSDHSSGSLKGTKEY